MAKLNKAEVNYLKEARKVLKAEEMERTRAIEKCSTEREISTIAAKLQKENANVFKEYYKEEPAEGSFSSETYLDKIDMLQRLIIKAKKKLSEIRAEIDPGFTD